MRKSSLSSSAETLKCIRLPQKEYLKYVSELTEKVTLNIEEKQISFIWSNGKHGNGAREYLFDIMAADLKVKSILDISIMEKIVYIYYEDMPASGVDYEAMRTDVVAVRCAKKLDAIIERINTMPSVGQKIVDNDFLTSDYSTITFKFKALNGSRVTIRELQENIKKIMIKRNIEPNPKAWVINDNGKYESITKSDDLIEFGGDYIIAIKLSPNISVEKYNKLNLIIKETFELLRIKTDNNLITK